MKILKYPAMHTSDNTDRQIIVNSPGRINLIGEHTDYNMGYVLPTAIEKSITFKLRKNGSASECKIFTAGLNEGFTLDLNNIARSEVEWKNYVLGVLNEISKLTDGVLGFNCTISSTLPLGSGLSSSAAMECGLAFGLNELFDLGLSKTTLVQLSQRAEHSFVGTECGIMDQFASVLSKMGHVILLDCESLEYEHIPMELQPYKILMLNTKVSHNLASSEYNVRKEECQAGIDIISKTFPEINSLRCVTPAMLETCKDQLPKIIYNRCSFILDENQRVLKMVKALKENNLSIVGDLLYQAHEGLSKLYEVSCPESDFLVEFSKGYEEVLGARQTGGGFGGCTLNIIHEDAVKDFISEATRAYKKEFNINLETFEVRPSGGTSIISRNTN